MPTPIRIRLNVPEHGWLPVEISAESGTFRAIVSEIPSDPLRALAEAASALAAGLPAPVVVLNEEPAEHRISFGDTGIEVRGPEPFSASGSRQNVALALWRGLRELEGRVDAARSAGHWRSPFPSDLVRSVGAHLREGRGG